MFLSQIDTESIIQGIESLELGQDQAVAILLSDKGRPDLGALVTELRGLNTPFFGGFFPGLIYDGQSHDQGAILAPMEMIHRPLVFAGIGKSSNHDFTSLQYIARDQNQDFTTIIMADGLARGVSSFLNDIYHHLGQGAHYFGGGAGSLTLRQEPCIFTEEGVFQDAALVVCANFASSLGVRHGWEVLEEPLVATRTEENRVLEINWENAFDVYRGIVESDSGKTLTPDSFLEIAGSYPFGMYRECAQEVVRDPIAVDDSGAMICVGEVPENTTLAIMKGVPANLVSAARLACDEALTLEEENLPVDPNTQVWVADCISRALFLGDEFSSELAIINDQARKAGITSPIKGALTLGEISSHGHRVLEYLNKTIVVGGFRAR